MRFADRVRIAHRRRVRRVLHERHEKDDDEREGGEQDARARGAGAADASVDGREREREQPAEREAVDDGRRDQPEALLHRARDDRRLLLVVVRRSRLLLLERDGAIHVPFAHDARESGGEQAAAQPGDEPADEKVPQHFVT